MTTPLERVLAQTLDAVERAAPEPPPNFVEAVNKGLRHRRRRHLVAASAATAVALVMVAAVTILRPASPPADVAIAPTTAPASGAIAVITDGCTVRELPLPSSFPGHPQLVRATDVDPTGRYVAGYVAGDAGSWAVLWVDGKPRVLDKAPGSYTAAVNAAGVAVGWSTGGGWVYRDGRVSPLPTLSGPGAADPTAINSRGDIVGGSGARGAIWPADQLGQVRPAGDGAGIIRSISDDGLMVGDGLIVETNSPGEARLWNPDGTIHALPPGFQYRPKLVAGPWVLGEADAVGNNTGPVGVRDALWNVTTGAVIPFAVDTTTTGFMANTLSESGAVVGYFVDADHSDRPAAFRDGKVILLPLPEGHSDDDVEAGAISADGRTIVGTALTQALLWHC